VNLATVRRLLLALPGVEEGSSYGTPGFRVKGKFLARMKEDGETRYPTILIRLRRVSLNDLREVLEVAWRYNAPKRLITEWETQQKRRQS